MILSQHFHVNTSGRKRRQGFNGSYVFSVVNNKKVKSPFSHGSPSGPCKAVDPSAASRVPPRPDTEDWRTGRRSQTYRRLIRTDQLLWVCRDLIEMMIRADSRGVVCSVRPDKHGPSFRRIYRVDGFHSASLDPTRFTLSKKES